MAIKAVLHNSTQELVITRDIVDTRAFLLLEAELKRYRWERIRWDSISFTSSKCTFKKPKYYEVAVKQNTDELNIIIARLPLLRSFEGLALALQD